MGRRRRPQDQATCAEFDMTPMIDVVFQLIVFFLIANDLSKKEVVDLELPQALAGVEDVAKEKYRVILNIKKPDSPDQKLPTVMVKGKPMTLKELERFLQGMADLEREGTGPGQPSAVYALIRADKNTPWQHVQYVMQVCADPKIAIYKMQFATTKRDDGKASGPGK